MRASRIDLSSRSGISCASSGPANQFDSHGVLPSDHLKEDADGRRTQPSCSRAPWRCLSSRHSPSSRCTAGASPIASSRCRSDVFLVAQGSLYPALVRMKRRGWVKTSWRVTENNRRARYYELTAAGTRTTRRRAVGVGPRIGRDQRHHERPYRPGALGDRGIMSILSIVTDLIERIRALVFRRSEEREMAEELRFHVDMEAEYRRRIRRQRRRRTPRQPHRARRHRTREGRRARRARHTPGRRWHRRRRDSLRARSRGRRASPSSRFSRSPSASVERPPCSAQSTRYCSSRCRTRNQGNSYAVSE